YTPLDLTNREIRLVRRCVDRKTNTSPKDEYNISVVSLDSAPAYTALSYVWGSSERSREIKCNGKRLPTTDSLYRLLERSRLSDADWLWADAVCIDQDNLLERSSQVAFMEEIYSRAARVAIYLDGFSDTEANAMYELCKYSFRYLQDGTKADSYTRGISMDQLQSLVKLFSHPWFSRSWVLQELVI
ncbi:hypothetical protein K458DRAFT_265036, partial [Lentithecium fluviatile CBS 122367]